MNSKLPHKHLYLRNQLYNMSHLGFFITHVCDKNCRLCHQRIQTSEYKHLRKEEFEYIISCIKNPEEITSILLTGGEPLLHPHFSWLINRILEDFPNARIEVITNGKSLAKLRKDIFSKIEFLISEYPSWNDDIIRKYKRYPNIR
ncbi:MAG: radical SAM protein, partial [Candidatus Hodarchaeota archaeon]